MLPFLFFCFKYVLLYDSWFIPVMSSLPYIPSYLPVSLSCHCIVSVWEKTTGRQFEGEQQLHTNMPTHQLNLPNHFPVRCRHLVVYLYVCVCVFISAALFTVGHFSPEWDFVSGAHWLALILGSKTHLEVLWSEREKHCEWWSRLWSDPLVLSSASSHYTANTHTGCVASLAP